TDDLSTSTSGTFHVFSHNAIIVILAERFNLCPRLRQAPRNFLVRILPPAAEPALQFCTRRRQNENRHGLGQLLFYLSRALDINLQHQVETLRVRFPDPFLRCAVAILPEYPRILEKLATSRHGFKFLFRDEIITLPTGLSRAARPGST